MVINRESLHKVGFCARFFSMLSFPGQLKAFIKSHYIKQLINHSLISNIDISSACSCICVFVLRFRIECLSTVTFTTLRTPLKRSIPLAILRTVRNI